jgi:DNA-binding PadR family transcriptional regulator
VRSWTGYELTRQVHRSLRFIWPTSEGHLYREQKRLVTLGWAVVERERTGRRARNRYTITPAGREALPSVALALDITTRLLEEIEGFFEVEAATVRQGQEPGPAATRRRLQAILARAEA